MGIAMDDIFGFLKGIDMVALPSSRVGGETNSRHNYI